MGQDIPKQQHAVVFEKSKGPIKVRDDYPVVQLNKLQPGQALVRVEFSSVDRDDLDIYKGEWPISSKLPLVGGHAGSGRIVAIAENTPNLQAKEFKVGDEVGIKWLADSCLNCEHCREGQEALCNHARYTGFSQDGTFEQYCVASLCHLTRIPKGLAMDQAASLLGGGVCAYRAIQDSRAKPGDFVVIAGAGGPIGHLVIQYARAMSLRVIAIDTGSERKKICEEFKVECFIDYKQEKNIIERVKNVSEGMGAHAAIMCTSSDEAYNHATHYLRPRGTLVAVGLPPNTNLKLDIFWTVFKALRIVGANCGSRQDSVDALELGACGKVKAKLFVEQLKDVEEVYRRIEAREIVGRVVFKNQ